MGLSDSARLDARHRAENDLWFLATEILDWHFLRERAHKPICDWAVAADCSPEDWRRGLGINQTRMLLLNRYGGKTTLFTIADNIRLQLKYPGLSIAVGHDSKDIAIQLLSQVRQEFETKAKLKWIAPDVCWKNPARESPQWNADKFMLKRAAYYRVPSFMAVSPDAMPTAMHFDVWDWDDLITYENSRTHHQRERCKNAYELAVPFLPPTRLGYRKVCGTRWHIGDHYGVIETELRKRDPSRLFVAGLLAPDGEPWLNESFCVERTGPEDRRKTVAELKEEMGGSQKFAACMMNDPLPEGTASFHVDDVQEYDLVGEGAEDWVPPVDGLNWTFFTAVDLNTQSHTVGDACVVLTAAKSNHGHLVVVDVSRGHPTPSQRVAWCERHNLTWRPRTLFVETVAYQKTFIGDLAEARAASGDWMPVEQVPRGGAKTGASKNDRIMSLQGVMEARKVWVPKGDRFAFLLDEIKEFAAESDSRIDDGLDCLADIHRLGRRPVGDVPKTEIHAPEQLLTDHFLGRIPYDLRHDDGVESIEW